MTSQHKLVELKQDVIVGARWMGHSISEIVVAFDIHWSMSHMHYEYLIEGITTHGQCSGQP